MTAADTAYVKYVLEAFCLNPVPVYWSNVQKPVHCLFFLALFLPKGGFGRSFGAVHVAPYPLQNCVSTSNACMCTLNRTHHAGKGMLFYHIDNSILQNSTTLACSFIQDGALLLCMRAITKSCAFLEIGISGWAIAIKLYFYTAIRVCGYFHCALWTHTSPYVHLSWISMHGPTEHPHSRVRGQWQTK